MKLPMFLAILLVIFGACLYIEVQAQPKRALDVVDTKANGSRILDVTSSVKNFCVTFLNEKAEIKPVSYKGAVAQQHCFTFKGRQRLIFDNVPDSLSYIVKETK